MRLKDKHITFMKLAGIVRAIRSELYVDFERMIQITLIGIVALIIWAFLQQQENPLTSLTTENSDNLNSEFDSETQSP